MVAEDDFSEDGNNEFDMEDILVQTVDGVLIKEKKEEVRLLFFYIKPRIDKSDDGIFHYKAVAEFRLSKSTFQSMLNYIEKRTEDLNYVRIRNDDKQPMFV